MASRRNLSHRNSPGFSLLKGVIAGALLGFTAFLGKILLPTGLGFGPSFVINVIINPILWLLIVTGVSGFLIFQKTLYSGKVSIIASIVGGFSVIVPVLLAFAFLGELISELKWIGIALVLIGVVGLGK